MRWRDEMRKQALVSKEALHKAYMNALHSVGAGNAELHSNRVRMTDHTYARLMSEVREISSEFRRLMMNITVPMKAMKFETNNDVGSTHMDSIVNWMNQGRDHCAGWHNGTDIFVFAPEGEIRACVGDWICKDPTGSFCVRGDKHVQAFATPAVATERGEDK